MHDDEQNGHAHLWTASLIFVGFEALVIAGALALIALAGRR